MLQQEPAQDLGLRYFPSWVVSQMGGKGRRERRLAELAFSAILVEPRYQPPRSVGG